MALDGAVHSGGRRGGGRNVAGRGGRWWWRANRRVAAFEPAPPDLARHGPRPNNGYIKH
jgi:hypothetical protein